MIKPTIGRKVWYFVRNPDGRLVSNGDGKGPFDANIVYVWSDNLINVAGFDHNGVPFARTSVPINETEGASAWCEWMPYQQGQAQSAQAAVATIKPQGQ